MEFREVAKLFITSFSRPSFMETLGKEAATMKEKSMTPKETPKKPQRSYPGSPEKTAFPQHQGTGSSVWDEYA